MSDADGPTPATPDPPSAQGGEQGESNANAGTRPPPTNPTPTPGAAGTPPPIEHQWRKGQSGNPRGSSVTQALRAAIKTVLDKQLPTDSRRTYMEGLAEAAVLHAIKGKPTFFSLVAVASDGDWKRSAPDTQGQSLVIIQGGNPDAAPIEPAPPPGTTSPQHEQQEPSHDATEHPRGREDEGPGQEAAAGAKGEGRSQPADTEPDPHRGADPQPPADGNGGAPRRRRLDWAPPGRGD